jgi:hypothetical protein
VHGFKGADDYLPILCRDLRWWWEMQFFLGNGAWKKERADDSLP